MVLYASFQKYLPGIPNGYMIEGPKSVNEILTGLGIPEEHVMLMTINGKICQPDSAVNGGDRLCLFPLIGGG